MSNSTNPQNLGVTEDVSEVGVLSSFNTKDTYQFTTPNLNQLIDENSNFGRQFSQVQPTGFDINVSTNLSTPAIVSFGIDRNNNGIFESSEITATETLDSFNRELQISDISSSLDDNLLKLGQSYFVQFESTNPAISNAYLVDVETVPIFNGELNDNDLSYISGDSRYYYDQLDEFALQNGDFNGLVEVGDEYFASVWSESLLDPVLFLLNKDTNEVLDVAYEPEIITLGGEDYNLIGLDFTVEEGINYTFSVEGLEAGQTGNYYFGLL